MMFLEYFYALKQHECHKNEKSTQNSITEYNIGTKFVCNCKSF